MIAQGLEQLRMRQMRTQPGRMSRAVTACVEKIYIMIARFALPTVMDQAPIASYRLHTAVPACCPHSDIVVRI